LKLISILSSDLTVGQAVAQVSHGIAEFAYEHHDLFSFWKTNSNSVVVLSSTDLKSLKTKLNNKGFQFSEFIEPDLDDKLTVLTVYGKSEVRRYLSYLPLYGKELNSNSNKEVKNV
jgi:predicted DNA binding CopG/RHH family protein